MQKHIICRTLQNILACNHEYDDGNEVCIGHHEHRETHYGCVKSDNAGHLQAFDVEGFCWSACPGNWTSGNWTDGGWCLTSSKTDPSLSYCSKNEDCRDGDYWTDCVTECNYHEAVSDFFVLYRNWILLNDTHNS